MKRSITALFLLFSVFVTHGVSQTSSTKDLARIEKIKTQVKKFASNQKTVIATSLISTRTKGVVTDFDDETFSIRNKKTGDVTTLKYRDTAKIGKTGVTTAGWIAIAGVGAGAAILLGMLGKRCSNEGGCF